MMFFMSIMTVNHDIQLFTSPVELLGRKSVDAASILRYVGKSWNSYNNYILPSHSGPQAHE